MIVPFFAIKAKLLWPGVEAKRQHISKGKGERAKGRMPFGRLVLKLGSFGQFLASGCQLPANCFEILRVWF
jgi:hypothetical protein